MVQPVISSPKLAPGTEPVTTDVSGEEQAANAKTLAGLNDFLRKYAPPKEHSEQDTLQDRYRADLSAPLPEFDNPNARAYSASDKLESAKPMFVHICEHGSVQRARAIEQLKGFEHDSILQLVAAGRIELSSNGEERFAIFYERPEGTKLSTLLAEKKIPLNQQFISEHILMPLASALQQFEQLNISHGLLNVDNIYFNEKAVLGPCVAEPSGYSQPYYYESLERLQAMPSAKGEGSLAQDYYALAVVTLHILHGLDHCADLTKEALMLRILRDGAYNTMMRGKEVPEIFYDFFRGSLTQVPEDRWTHRQLKTWLEGKRYNVLQPPPPMDASRPFEFGDKTAVTRRELAHLFASDWEHMIVTLQNNQLAHWVSVSLRNKELAETIGRMSRTVAELSAKNTTQTHEMLMNIVLLLDPQGPIRINHMSMHIDGIDSMCAEMHAKKAHHDLQFLAGFIESNMVNYWLTLQTKSNPEYKVPPTVNAMFIKLDRLRTCIRSAGLGFGLERMLYDLNPDLPCMSPLLATRHVTTLLGLLKQLDRMASTLPGEEIIDKHIAAFIASKLSIQNEIKLHDLSAIPAMATNRTIMTLHLLAMMQERVENIKLPGLTHWLTVRLLPLIDGIHSQTIRKQVRSLLLHLAPQGSTQKIAELIITADYAQADTKGFQQAIAKYRQNELEIRSLQTPERLRQESSKLGSSIAGTLAYMTLCVSVVIILKGIMS